MTRYFCNYCNTELTDANRIKPTSSYLRLMTKDSIHVTREEMKFLPSSINGQLGYVPKVEGI